MLCQKQPGLPNGTMRFAAHKGAMILAMMIDKAGACPPMVRG